MFAPRKVNLDNLNLFDLILEIFVVSNVALMLSYYPFLFSDLFLVFFCSSYCLFLDSRYPTFQLFSGTNLDHLNFFALKLEIAASEKKLGVSNKT